MYVNAFCYKVKKALQIWESSSCTKPSITLVEYFSFLFSIQPPTISLKF